MDLESQVPARHHINAATTADQILEEEALRNRRERTVSVAPGDTLMGLLQEAGVAAGDAYQAVDALKDVYSPRDIRPGQEIRLALIDDPAASDRDEVARLESLRLRASVEQDVAVTQDGNGGYVAATAERDLVAGTAGAAGEINSSLFADGQSLDIPVPVILEMIRNFSYAIDFQRDLQAGDKFAVLYETLSEADGRFAKAGPLKYAAMERNGELLEMYRHETSDGEIDYFDPEGESVRRLLMRTPIDGARVSSGYGMREHPILGYSRMHPGVDFAAPTGTPIYAAGNGEVEYAGWNGGYGKYVRIRHRDPYKTVYAHLSRFADGVEPGARVQQGEVIGYVGTTGQSTGPHLHYEVMVAGEQVNPQGLDIPTGRTLEGAELARFRERMADIDRLRKESVDSTRIAEAGCGPSPNMSHQAKPRARC